MSEPARILLAEDDRILRKAGEVALKKKGYTVVVAVDGEDALEKAGTHELDLILLDVMMPKLDGFEVLTRLKQSPATRDVPVIMLSNLSQEADVRRAIDGGARGYLVKSNLGPEQLAAHVADALAGRPPVG